MAQKPFFMDAGIRIGNWIVYQDSNGDLQVAPADNVNLSQMPFLVDAGFKMGDFAWYQSGDDLTMSEDDSSLDQRPFYVDGGIRIGDWIFQINADSVIEVTQATTSNTSNTSTTTISGGEGFATGYASTEWQTAADSATGNPRIIINTHYPSLDSDWKTALDNWEVGNTLVLKTPVQFDGTTLTTTGGISSTVSGDYKQYFFDVDVAHSISVYIYQVEHTTSGSSSSSSSGSSTTSTALTPDADFYIVAGKGSTGSRYTGSRYSWDFAKTTYAQDLGIYGTNQTSNVSSVNVSTTWTNYDSTQDTYFRVDGDANSPVEYKVFSRQATGIGMKQPNGQTETHRYAGNPYVHAWKITIPAGGRLYVRPGQPANKFAGTNNGDTYHSGNYPGGSGGIGQIWVYDPDVSTGTTIDGVKVNAILHITSTSGGSTSQSGGASNEGINETTSFLSNYFTLGAENVHQTPIHNQQIGIYTYGGFPGGLGYPGSPTNTAYFSDYVEPINDWTGYTFGSKTMSAETGTNYSDGFQYTNIGHTSAYGGYFDFKKYE